MRTRLLPAIGMIMGVCAMVGFAFWLRGSSGAAMAAPQVRVADTRVTAGDLRPGDVVTITSTLHGDGGALKDLTVELEIHSADSQIVLRAPRRGVNLEPSRDVPVSWVWRLPADFAAGSYTTEVSVYGDNWSPLYTREENGATFVVGPKR